MPCGCFQKIGKFYDKEKNNDKQKHPDLCKTNMYEKKVRNSKNEETGNWEKVPYYKVKDDYLSCGHGVESMIRLNKYVAMPEPWNQAIRWHMGAYDISPMNKLSLKKSLAAYREVLFLQTADMSSKVKEKPAEQTHFFSTVSRLCSVRESIAPEVPGLYQQG